MGRGKWTDEQFGKRIKAERERRRWSQTQMAEMLSRRTPMHATTIAKIEAGDRSVRVTEAMAFADLFEVTVDALLGRTGPDQSSLAFALLVLNDYARSGERLIDQALQVIADLEDQLESVKEEFDVPSIGELHRATADSKNHLDSAQLCIRRLESLAQHAIIADNSGAPGHLRSQGEPRDT